MTTLNELDSALRDSTVTRPGDPDWDAVRRPWNVAVDQHPVAVVAIGDAADVSTTVKHAALAGLSVTAQPGGHGATRALDGTVMLRTSALREITIDPVRRIARVGAGVKWGAFLPHLDGTGLIALTGSSPDVSVVGYLLGGGLSWFSRKYGPASRSVTAVELVTADGAERRVTAASDPDLFWALRGGGGEYGIVTAIEFQLYAEPALAGGQLMFPGEQAPAVLAAVGELTAVAPRELTVWAGIMHFPTAPSVPEPMRGKTFTIVNVTYLGAESALTALLWTIRDAGTVLHDTVGTVPIGRVGEIAAEPVQPTPSMDQTQLLARFDEDVIARLVDAVGVHSGTAITLAMVRHLGGAVGEAGLDGVAGAVPAPYLLFALGAPVNAEAAARIEASFAALRRAIGPDGSDRVPFNFLGGRGIADAYPAADIERLRDVKRRHDPHGVIRGNRPL